MKKTLLILLVLSGTLFAKLNIAVSYPYIADITNEIAGNKATITALAKGSWDPHFVVPTPSLITKVSRADLLIINGAQLEIGWLPQIIRQSHNAKIQIGAKGLLNLSYSIALIDKVANVSRANGDIHPDGNPHYILDPHNVLPLAQAIAEKLADIDEDNAALYLANADKFIATFKKNIQRYDESMQKYEGLKVIQYHELFNYFIKRYKLVKIDNIEPLPGINPSSRHTLELIKEMKAENIKTIFQDVYHSDKTAQFIASKTDAKVLVLPHDVHAIQSIDSLDDLYSNIIRKLQ